MATPTELATPKQNRGNRRTGPSRNHRTYTGRKKGNLPWQKDPVILQRLEVVLARTLQGRSAREIGTELSLDPDTIYDDRKRIRELAQEQVLGSLTESVGRLRWVMANAEQAFLETKETSLNRSAYLNTYLSATTAEAKLLGQEPRAKADVEVTLKNGDLDLDQEIERRLRERMEGMAGKPRLVVESSNGVAKLGQGRTEAS